MFYAATLLRRERAAAVVPGRSDAHMETPSVVILDVPVAAVNFESFHVPSRFTATRPVRAMRRQHNGSAPLNQGGGAAQRTKTHMRTGPLAALLDCRTLRCPDVITAKSGGVERLADLRRADAHLPESNWSQIGTPVLRARKMRLLYRTHPLISSKELRISLGPSSAESAKTGFSNGIYFPPSFSRRPFSLGVSPTTPAM